MDYDYAALRAEAKVSLERYSKAHQRCPQCKATRSTTQTYVGYIMVIGSEDQHRDKNEAVCRCGWKGIVHDMLPE